MSNERRGLFAPTAGSVEESYLFGIDGPMILYVRCIHTTYIVTCIICVHVLTFTVFHARAVKSVFLF